MLQGERRKRLRFLRGTTKGEKKKKNVTPGRQEKKKKGPTTPKDKRKKKKDAFSHESVGEKKPAQHIIARTKGERERRTTGYI